MLELHIQIDNNCFNVLVDQKIVMVRATDQYGNVYNASYKLTNAQPKYKRSFSACGYVKDIKKPKSLFFIKDISDKCEVENLLYDDTGSYKALYQTNLLSFYHSQVKNGLIKIEIGHNM